MSLKNFFIFVEIRTTFMSIIGYLLGMAFVLSYFGTINWINSLIYFIGMIFFDFVTTGINNIMDYLKAKDEKYKNEVNILSTANISLKYAVTLVVSMLLCASISGLILVFRTNILLLFIGGFCFLVGIFYTFGPLPLSRMALGELFSGLVQGFGIPFIFVYINVPQKMLALNFTANWDYEITGSLTALIAIFLMAYPQMCAIANIMLANNISDIDFDIKNHRSTFPIVVGKKSAGTLFKFLAYSPYFIIVLCIFLKILPLTSLLVLLTAIIVHKNTKAFLAHPDKDQTFPLSIQNAIITNGALILSLFMGLLLPH